MPLIQFRKNVSLLGYGITRFHCNLTNHYSNTPLNKAEPNTLLTFIDLCLVASNQENSQSDRNSSKITTIGNLVKIEDGRHVQIERKRYVRVQNTIATAKPLV